MLHAANRACSARFNFERISARVSGLSFDAYSAARSVSREAMFVALKSTKFIGSSPRILRRGDMRTCIEEWIDMRGDRAERISLYVLPTGRGQLSRCRTQHAIHAPIREPLRRSKPSASRARG